MKFDGNGACNTDKPTITYSALIAKNVKIIKQAELANEPVLYPVAPEKLLTTRLFEYRLGGLRSIDS
jgi:hypothetical protein